MHTGDRSAEEMRDPKGDRSVHGVVMTVEKTPIKEEEPQKKLQRGRTILPEGKIEMIKSPPFQMLLGRSLAHSV